MPKEDKERNILEAKKVLLDNAQTAEDLRKKYAKGLKEKYPDLSDLLEGEFVPEEFTDYENGLVVSRPLKLAERKKGKDSTNGVSLRGQHSFPIKDYNETIYVLEGTLEASVNDEPSYTLRQYESIRADIGDRLYVKSESPVIYLCTYTPPK